MYRKIITNDKKPIENGFQLDKSKFVKRKVGDGPETITWEYNNDMIRLVYNPDSVIDYYGMFFPTRPIIR